MFLKSVYVKKFKVLDDISLSFDSKYNPTIYPLASLNGGGKSTFLQLIFILMYTSFDSDKNKLIYLKNMLKDLDSPKNSQLELFSTFNLQNDENNIAIDFYLANNNYLDLNLESIVTFQNLESEYLAGKYQRPLDECKNLKDKFSLEVHDIDRKRFSPRFDLNFKRKLHSIIQFGDTKHRNLYQKFEESDSIDDLINLLEDLIYYFSEKVFFIMDELENFRIKKEFTLQKLKENSLNYVTDLNSNTFFLYKTSGEIPNDFLSMISDKIYLVAPNTQVFSFLDMEAKNTLFLSENNAYNDVKITEFYDYHVRNSKRYLSNFFTYEFASTTLIINSFKKARDKDFEEAVSSGSYGKNLTNLQHDLDSFLINKSISVDKNLRRVIFKLKDSNKELNPEDLSHGELKKLGLFIWLKYKHLSDSIILMDEVENGLHPDWQFSIIGDLAKWSPNNQFILATHSYEICDALTPSHISELNPKLLKKN